jgi:hypothetical protein
MHQAPRPRALIDGFAVIGSDEGRRALPRAGLAAPFLIAAAKIPRLGKRGDSAAKDQASRGKLDPRQAFRLWMMVCEIDIALT